MEKASSRITEQNTEEERSNSIYVHSVKPFTDNQCMLIHTDSLTI